MCKMNNEDKRIIENEIRMIMQKATSSDYARYILDHKKKRRTFMDDVIDDVMCSSAWEDEAYYNDYDIGLAIGRVLMCRLGIDY